MALLYAAYLAGAALIGVPILLHLLRRKPKQRQPFPSFMFLTRTAPQRQNSNNIRKWLVLAARCLILLLLSLGFAWPFIPKFDETPESATILLWDNSFSMNASPYRDQLLHTAQDRIDDASDKHPMQIGIIGDRVDWSGDIEGDPATLRSFFDKRAPAQGSSRFERALRQADLKLQRSNADERKIVLVSDRQLAPWQDVRLSQALRPGTTLEFIAPKSAGYRNVAVHDARIDTRFTEADQELAMRVGVRNYSLGPVKATLETRVAGELVDSRVIELPAMGVRSELVSLPPRPLEPAVGMVKLVVDDDLDTDNQAWFAINPEAAPTVGILRPDREPQATLFVELAMNPSADVTRVNIIDLAEDPSADALQRCDLLVIADAPSLQSDAAERIESTLLSGGNVVALWRDTSPMRRWLRQWDIQATPTDRKKAHRLASIDFEHPIFAPFMDVRVGGLFEVMYFGPPHVEAPEKARVLARFDSGDPAILEHSVGKGRLFIVSTAVTRAATDWPTHASFLPFWRELLAYASREQKDAYHHDVSNRPLHLDGLKHVTNSVGEDITLEQERFTPIRAGGYFVEADGQPRVAIAVNPPVAESDPIAVGDAFSTTALVSTEEAPVQVAGAFALPEDQGKSFWWIVLALAGALMIFETLLANRTAL